MDTAVVNVAVVRMLMPVLVVLPGIAAAVLAPDLSASDKAYPEVMKLLPVGIKGLVFAALIAAIVSSLASMMNSISTIFTMDIVAHYAKRSEQQLVTVGRVTSLTALIVAVIVARPLLGNFDQAFQYIQEFTGFFTPGITAIWCCFSRAKAKSSPLSPVARISSIAYIAPAIGTGCTTFCPRSASVVISRRRLKGAATAFSAAVP